MRKLSEQHKKNISEGAKKVGSGKWMLGRKLSKETRAKLSLAFKGKKRTNMTDEIKKKISISKKGTKMGENHPRYISDRTKLQRYNDDSKDRISSAYRDWRTQVWLRDNFKCKIANPDCEGRIEAHHILGWKSHPELRYQINNGITLCHAHHPRKRAEEKRLSPYFMELVSVSKKSN